MLLNILCPKVSNLCQSSTSDIYGTTSAPFTSIERLSNASGNIFTKRRTNIKSAQLDNTISLRFYY